MRTGRQYEVGIAMRFSVAVVVLCVVDYFHDLCRAAHGPRILGSSIPSVELKNVEVQQNEDPEQKQQIVSMRPQAMDSDSDCDDNATEFNIADILNENSVQEQVKRGPSIAGPNITSAILKKYEVELQPLPDSLTKSTRAHPQSTDYKGIDAGAPGSDVNTLNDEDVQKKQDKKRPAIIGPQITSTILKKHSVKPQLLGDETEKDQRLKENKKDADQNLNKEKEDNLDDEELLKDMHRNVVLIEVTFANNVKKYRTGTVIHDHVVLTAAHYFEDFTTRNNKVELTFSFVIIGTKRAFDRGSSHYLPIEKLIIHPEHKGWNADLALVFTYSRIATDNYGFPMPIEGYEPVIRDASSLVVASWGRCNRAPYNLGEKYLYRSNNKIISQEQSRADVKSFGAKDNFRTMVDEVLLENNSKTQSRDPILQMSNVGDYIEGEILNNNPNIEPYRRNANILKQSIEKKYIPDITDTRNRLNNKQNKTDIDDFYTKLSKTEIDDIKLDDKFLNATQIFEYYKSKLLSETNTRRKMSQPKNRLVIGEFQVANEKSCKALLARIMPLKHKILNPNQFLCFSSLDKYLTRSDAGAPLIQGGKLVAVTAGGVESDGKHIGVGLKMSCFCTWIAQNLQNRGGKFDCGKDCCGNRIENGKDLRRENQKNIIRSRRRGS